MSPKQIPFDAAWAVAESKGFKDGEAVCVHPTAQELVDFEDPTVICEACPKAAPTRIMRGHLKRSHPKTAQALHGRVSTALLRILEKNGNRITYRRGPRTQATREAYSSARRAPSFSSAFSLGSAGDPLDCTGAGGSADDEVDGRSEGRGEGSATSGGVLSDSSAPLAPPADPVPPVPLVPAEATPPPAPSAPSAGPYDTHMVTDEQLAYLIWKDQARKQDDEVDAAFQELHQARNLLAKQKIQHDALTGKIARQEAVVADKTADWLATQAAARATKNRVTSLAREYGWDADMG